MQRIKMITSSKVLRRVAPIIFVAMAGVGLASCGSSAVTGGTGSHQNTTTTVPSGSGGAGF
jgi:hypothetical protein